MKSLHSAASQMCLCRYCQAGRTDRGKIAYMYLILSDIIRLDTDRHLLHKGASQMHLSIVQPGSPAQYSFLQKLVGEPDQVLSGRVLHPMFFSPKKS